MFSLLLLPSIFSSFCFIRSYTYICETRTFIKSIRKKKYVNIFYGKTFTKKKEKFQKSLELILEYIQIFSKLSDGEKFLIYVYIQQQYRRNTFPTFYMYKYCNKKKIERQEKNWHRMFSSILIHISLL